MKTPAENGATTRSSAATTAGLASANPPALPVQGPVPASWSEPWTLPWLALMVVLGMGVFVLIFCLYYAKAIALPLTAGAILGLIIGPTADRLRDRGVPAAITYSVILLAMAGFFFSVYSAVYPTLADWINRAPEIASSLQIKFSFLQRPFEQLLHLGGGKSNGLAVVVQENDQTKMVTGVLATLTPALTQMFIFLFCLIFFLAGRMQLRNSIVLRFEDRQDRLVALRTFSTIERSLLTYFGTVTMINAALGVLTGLLMWVVGMEKPLVWGFLAFLVNFLPIVGPLMLKALLLVGGMLLMPDFTRGFIPVLAYLALVTIEANYVTPTIVGTRFTVNPFLVFLSVVFWSWLWGFFGAFLAMPILVVATTIIDALQRDDKVQIPG